MGLDGPVIFDVSSLRSSACDPPPFYRHDLREVRNLDIYRFDATFAPLYVRPQSIWQHRQGKTPAAKMPGCG